MKRTRRMGISKAGISRAGSVTGIRRGRIRLLHFLRNFFLRKKFRK